MAQRIASINHSRAQYHIANEQPRTVCSGPSTGSGPSNRLTNDALKLPLNVRLMSAQSVSPKSALSTFPFGFITPVNWFCDARSNRYSVAPITPQITRHVYNNTHTCIHTHTRTRAPKRAHCPLMFRVKSNGFDWKFIIF